ncbi:MAG: PRC-barrel domain-containing protein [Caldilineaceae bacterium]
MNANGDTIVRAESLIGIGVNDIGLGVSNVDDMLIDLGQSTVEYVVLAYDASLVGNDLVLVPFDAFNTGMTDNQLTFRQGIDSAMIQDAPRITRDNLIAGDSQAFTDMNNYWGGLGYGPMMTGNRVAQQDEITSEEQGLTITDNMGVSDANNQLVRASTLLDYNTTNLNGESIGNIEDMLIDVESGHILFATLEYGGFLDIGDREIPIPLSALSWVSENELMLNLDEQQLDALPDVGQNWPNVTDATWNDEIVDFWDNNGFDAGYGATDAQTVMYALESTDYDFGDVGLGTNGSINDILIDLSQSQALWVIVDYGGLFNDELVPVPFSAIDVSTNGDAFSFTPNVDLNMFENAPTLDRNTFDQGGLFDNTFDDNVTTYWEDGGYTVGTDANMNQ